MRARASLTALLALAAGALCLQAEPAQAAGLPQVASVRVSNVTATSAKLNAEVNPNGLSSTARFEYLTAVAFQANLDAAKDGFTGALKAPVGFATPIGSGAGTLAYSQQVGNLKSDTAYRYRLVAVNSAGSANAEINSSGGPLTFVTRVFAPTFGLPDGRGWELVSPTDKNGGQVQGPGASFGGGVLQAAAQGGAVTYTSASFFAGGEGAPGASQYISRRASGRWSTQNVTPPLLAGGYPSDPDSGVPYQLFSADLTLGLVSNGRRCRSEAGEACPVANPPLPGSGAPAGYRNYYLRSEAGFEALLGAGDLAGLTLGPERFEVAFAGADDDLSHIVLSSCAALTPDATEVPLGDGCDPAATNLYLWSASGLELLSVPPGEAVGAPGAELAAPGGAISGGGSRVYWAHGGNLYLREGEETVQVDEGAGGGGTFQVAAGGGAIAFFTKAGHLYRYLAAAETATDLTPGGGVLGVLGASENGSRVYYLTAAGLFLREGGATIPVADHAAASSYPPATGTAHLSTDGARLAFTSTQSLTGFDNDGQAEVYLYDATEASLLCASCNPTGERPIGPASLPGANPNGTAPAAYKPRALVASGDRLYFDTEDSLATQDTNNDRDVYQWQAAGSGGCAKASGCLSLISSGRAENGASFVDASLDGSDVFFTTDGSLVPSDPGSVDLYDARVGGGFAVPTTPIPCVGDACQPIPSEPDDPTPGTLFHRAQGNDPVTIVKEGRRRSGKERKGKAKRGKGKRRAKGKRKAKGTRRAKSGRRSR